MPKAKPPVLKGSDGKPFVITINEFKGGQMSLLDETRVPQTAVTVAQNMVLDQDGVWRVREGSAQYGAGLVGPIDGLSDTVVVYNTDGTNTNYLFVMDNGSVKYSQNGGAWTTVGATGGGAKTYTVGKPCKFKQINSQLYIVNGKDNLSFVDLGLLTITTYTALSVPTGLSTSKAGLAGTSYTMYYRVTAVKNSIGETASSAETSITVGKTRTFSGASQTANWTAGTDSVTVTWSAVPGADRYNIYWADQPTGTAGYTETFLDSITGTSYVDNGQIQTNIYQQAPALDGTAGPTAGDISLSGNRVWTTNDPNNVYRVAWSAAGQYQGSFNPYYGGGYIDLEKGGAEKPVAVQHFRDGKATPVATVLTSNPMGGGSTWFITLTTVTANNLTIVIPQASKQGSIGTTGARGVVQANNNIYYPSVKGFQALGSQPNLLNVLVTSEISANIRPQVKGITNSAASGICGIYYYGRIYWSVPYANSTNNQIWVLDLERNVWCTYWTIGVKQFAEYTDANGVVHLLAVPTTGTSIIEFSTSFGSDTGIAFGADLESGLITWNNDHTQWARVDKVYVEIGRPNGNITFSVSGTQKNKALAQIGTATITSATSSSGIGADIVGAFVVGSSNTAPLSYSQSSVKKRILVRKRLNNIKWSITSSGSGASFTLLEVIIKGKILPTSDPGSWKGGSTAQTVKLPIVTSYNQPITT
ncbi:MAG: hypothetical protein NVS1B10_01620 [Candidatus Saccharimonadales bacterium]